MSMNYYIKEFENLINKINNCNMVLSYTVLAFKILKGTMINQNQYQIPQTLHGF